MRAANLLETSKTPLGAASPIFVGHALTRGCVVRFRKRHHFLP